MWGESWDNPSEIDSGLDECGVESWDNPSECDSGLDECRVNHEITLLRLTQKKNSPGLDECGITPSSV